MKLSPHPFSKAISYASMEGIRIDNTEFTNN